MPSKESMKSVTDSGIGGVGGFVSMLMKQPSSSLCGGEDGNVDTNNNHNDVPATPGDRRWRFISDDAPVVSPKLPVNPFTSPTPPTKME